MKRISLLLIFMAFPLIVFAQRTNSYVANAQEALNRKDYDKVMEWANRYAQEYNSYEPFKDIAEQMRQDAASIYPNDKKAFAKPLEYAASLGNAHALYTLGVQYAAGTFLPKDEAKGLALLKASEALGYSQAGPMYNQLKAAFDKNAAIDRALQERQRRYNAEILGAATAAAVVIAAAALIGHSFKSTGSSSGSSSNYGYSSSSSSSSYGSSSSSRSSSSSYSSSSNSSSSQTSSASKPSYTCNITIKYTENGEEYKLTANNIEVYFGSRGGYAKYWVDDKGNCTITWDTDRGDTITKILFSEYRHGSIFKNQYRADGLQLKAGGTYTVHAYEYY